MRARALGVVLLAAPLLWAADLPAAPAGVVADAANLFSAADRTKLEALGGQVLREKAVGLRVLTLADAKGEDPKAIAVRALNTWRVGQKSVLLLIVMNPRALYLQPGTALASSFDAQTSTGICASIVAPQMRSKAFGAAALAGLGAVRDRLALPPGAAPAAAPMQPSTSTAAVAPAPARPPRDRWPLLHYAVDTFYLDYIAAFALVAWPGRWLFSKVFARKCPKCRTRMSKWSRETHPPTFEAAGRGARSYICDCGHTETETYVISKKRRWGFGIGSGYRGGGTGTGDSYYDSSSSSSSSSSSCSSSSSSSSDSGSSSDSSGGGGSSW